MSNQLLPNPPEPTTDGEGIAAIVGPPGPSVSVFMPFNLEMEDLSAELFGQTFDMSGIIIKVNREIPVDALYTEDSGKNVNSWIKYLQQADEDSFEGYVNVDMADDVITEIKTSLYLPEGESYDPTNKGVEHLDASGVFPNVSPVAWQNYHNIQDVVLAIFAHTILGHPGALSIISNDSIIRASVSTAYDETLEKIKGADSRAITDSDTVLADLANISGNGVAGGLDQTDLAMILQQFMNQAPDRFAVGDRGTLMPLEWKVGDKFYIQMRMFNNKYQIKGGAPTDHPVLLNGDYSNVISPFGAPGISISDGYYVLEFTVGEASSGGGSSGGGSSGGGSSGGGSSGPPYTQPDLGFTISHAGWNSTTGVFTNNDNSLVLSNTSLRTSTAGTGTYSYTQPLNGSAWSVQVSIPGAQSTAGLGFNNSYTVTNSFVIRVSHPNDGLGSNANGDEVTLSINANSNIIVISRAGDTSVMGFINQIDFTVPHTLTLSYANELYTAKLDNLGYTEVTKSAMNPSAAPVLSIYGDMKEQVSGGPVTLGINVA